MASEKSSGNWILIIAIIMVILALATFFIFRSKLFGLERVLLAPTSPGNVTVVIAQNLDIVFTTNLINWSSGSVDPAFPSANLSSEGGIVGNLSFVNVTRGFVLENAGNVNANLSVSAAKNATTFIGGGGGSFVSPEYQFKLRNCNAADCTYTVKISNETDTAQSCLNASGGTDGLNLNVYQNVPTTQGQQVVACPTFRWEDIRDELRVDIRVVIPENAPLGSKADTVTASATIA